MVGIKVRDKLYLIGDMFFPKGNVPHGLRQMPQVHGMIHRSSLDLLRFRVAGPFIDACHGARDSATERMSPGTLTAPEYAGAGYASCGCVV